MTSRIPHHVELLDLGARGTHKVNGHRGGIMVLDVRDGAALNEDAQLRGRYLTGGTPVNDVAFYFRFVGFDSDWTPLKRGEQFRAIGAELYEIELFWTGVGGRRAVIATVDPEAFEAVTKNGV